MSRMLDLQITSNCNLNCKFCCGTPKCVQEKSYDEMKKVIDKLKKVNIERVVLTGGEPLLYKNIDDLIKYIYDSGIEIYLSTNAYFLDQHFNTIVRYASCVGMPLDGSNAEICEKMTRRSDQLQTTLSAVNKIKKANQNIKIKIGTVVSKINIQDLQNIKEVLCANENKPDVWRLYEFSPLGEGKVNRQYFEIDSKLFLDATNELKKDKNCSILISTLTNEDSNDAYIFIEPNLDIILLTNDEYIKVGNASDFSVNDFEVLFTNQLKTMQNQDKNRKWLNGGLYE